MLILSGKEVALTVRAEVKSACAEFIAETNHTPCLAVILVGDDPASSTYVASKGKACREMGFDYRDHRLAADVSEEEVMLLIASLNDDPSVDGILVQLPLPAHLDERRVIASMQDDKDVDGLHPVNIGRLMRGDARFIPCTPAGVLRILDHYGIATAGRDVVVIGRSNIVGKPMAALLMQKGRDATVTVCHSRTDNLSLHTRRADILISAIGKPLAVTADMVKRDAVVIDVGINRIDDPTRSRGYRLVGDLDYAGVSAVCSAITPVPGGVGPMTIAMLMHNAVKACKIQRNIKS